MKSRFFTILFLCAVFALNAQDKGAWQVGAVLSPSLSRTYWKSYNDFYYPRLFLSGSLNARYFINERLALGAGVVYLVNGSGRKLNDPNHSPDPSSAFPKENGFSKSQSIGIPVGVDWFISDKGKVNLTLGVDIMNAYTFKRQTVYSFLPKDDKNRVVEHDASYYSLALVPNIGVEVRLKEKLVLSAATTLSSQIRTKYRKILKARQMGYGLDIGLYLNL